jgi:hypothetical protein
MKRNIIIFVLFVFACVAQSQIKYKIDFLSEGVRVLEKKDDSGVFYNKVEFFNTDRTATVGYPSLPVKYLRFIIPSNSETLEVKLGNVEREIKKLEFKIEPTQPPIPTSIALQSNIIEIGTEKYDSIDVFPKDIVQIVSYDYFRGSHIVTVAVYPYQYYPNNNNLVINNLIEFSLDYNINVKKEIPIIRLDAEYREILESVIENKDNIDEFLGNKTAKSVKTIGLYTNSEYLIVTSTALAPAFDQFIAWKAKKGISVELFTIESILANYSEDIVSGISDDAGKLRQFLSDAYTNGCNFVLLAGDDSIVPVRYAFQNVPNSSVPLSFELKNIPTDLYFSDFDGNWEAVNDGVFGAVNDAVDFIPEIAVGRILVSNISEIKNWVKKTLIYENYPGFGDFSYLTKVFFTQADQMQANSEADSVLSRITWISSINKELLSEYGGSYTTFTPSSPMGSQVISKFNTHYGLCSFMGHGGPTNVAVATKYYNSNEKIYEYKTTISAIYLFCSNRKCCCTGISLCAFPRFRCVLERAVRIERT